MLTTLIIVSVVCWILGFFVNGFTLYNFLIAIPTIMFSVRKVGIHVKMSNIVAVECVMLFFSIVFMLIFKNFVWWKFLIGILLRIIFLCIVIYDDSVYVYVSEERKKT